MNYRYTIWNKKRTKLKGELYHHLRCKQDKEEQRITRTSKNFRLEKQILKFLPTNFCNKIKLAKISKPKTQITAYIWFKYKSFNIKHSC